jgi:hypothetical protein
MSERHQRRVRRVELQTMIGSAVAAVVLLPFGGTPARMSLFLFGWAGGCTLHLATQAVQKRARRRRRS